MYRAYRTLNLRYGASLEEVRRSYRALVKQYHPDRVRCYSSEDARRSVLERFYEIQSAYEAILQSGAAQTSAATVS